ncbi:hypothetical protein Pst134EA_031936 [Puccinia striiformis f. sp. tritici]|uniref:uncharacterized protein n=1 Tax=Puccinia striiformis f. sp. tritici TaxID=168172 RepID=UPI00200838CB|nr:uncharacterized protein Pst134EA_031936 [Puccinia striiformis f. sp. tritici]KAH9444429.1 hypothetical protein Pst134EA_031936 [Puccinia striiformis f. sp. tritici]
MAWAQRSPLQNWGSRSLSTGWDCRMCRSIGYQIKIRGFRIELGEIDTHLSQHPSIRENVTLVRRDKDEEKILITYFVPNQPKSGSSEIPLTSASELEDDEEPVSEVEKE